MFNPGALIVGAGVIAAVVLTPVLAVIGFSAVGPVAGKGKCLLHDSAIPCQTPLPFSKS